MDSSEKTAIRGRLVNNEFISMAKNQSKREAASTKFQHYYDSLSAKMESVLVPDQSPTRFNLSRNASSIFPIVSKNKNSFSFAREKNTESKLEGKERDSEPIYNLKPANFGFESNREPVGSVYKANQQRELRHFRNRSQIELGTEANRLNLKENERYSSLKRQNSRDRNGVLYESGRNSLGPELRQMQMEELLQGGTMKQGAQRVHQPGIGLHDYQEGNRKSFEFEGRRKENEDIRRSLKVSFGNLHSNDKETDDDHVVSI